MIQRALFLVCAVLATVSPFATWQINQPFNLNYIHTTSVPSQLMDNIEYVISAIRLLEIGDQDSQVDVVAKIKTLRDRHSQIIDIESSQYVSFCNDMLELSQRTDICDFQMIDRTVQIMILLNHYYDESLHKFAQFMRHIGLIKFSACAALSVVNLETQPYYSPTYEHNFDRFFRALLQMDSTSDEVFLGSLKLFDLASHNFETQQAVQIASEILTEIDEVSPHSSSFDIIHQFLFANCLEFTTRRWGDLQVLALADSFGDQSRAESDRVKKMKEYYRLCVTYSSKIKEVELNIRLQLNRADRIRSSGSATGSVSGSATGSATGSASGSRPRRRSSRRRSQ